jgi:hypothetical protein
MTEEQDQDEVKDEDLEEVAGGMDAPAEALRDTEDDPEARFAAEMQARLAT